MRAQKDFLRAPPCGCGAFRLEPVALLYLALPLAVSPAPFDTGSFSPRPTAREGVFLAIEHGYSHVGRSRGIDAILTTNTVARDRNV